MSPRYSFILPLQAAQPSHALKKGEIQTAAAEECVKRPRFQSSQTFSVLSPVCHSCNFAGGLSAKREKFTPKNLVSKSWHSDAKFFHFNSSQFPRIISEKGADLVSHFVRNNCLHNPNHCLHHDFHCDNGAMIAAMTALSLPSIIARFPRTGSRSKVKSLPGKTFLCAVATWLKVGNCKT